MDVSTLSTIAAILSGLSGSGGVYMWYDKKQRDKTLDKLAKGIEELSKEQNKLAREQVEHSNKFITEEATRKLLQEYISKLETSWSETNKDVKDIKNTLTDLSTELKVMIAIRDVEKEITKRDV